MKKVAILALAVILLGTKAVFAETGTVSSVSSDGYIQCEYSGGCQVYASNAAPTDSRLAQVFYHSGSRYNTNGDGKHGYIVYQRGVDTCYSNAPLGTCQSGSALYDNLYKWPDETVHYTAYTPPVVNMDTIISTASTTFSNAVGFNWSDVVLFMKQLLLLIVGSGLGLLETLLPYIIALVTISAIVYFIYRAFRFFKH